MQVNLTINGSCSFLFEELWDYLTTVEQIILFDELTCHQIILFEKRYVFPTR